MKKSLILLPLVALVLAGCTTGGSKGKKKKSSSESTSQKSSGSGSGPTVAPTSSGGGGTSRAVDFDLTPGTHTAVVDFEYNWEAYSYPRCEATDTEPKEQANAGITWNYFHTYRGSYEEAYWLHMRNKGSSDSDDSWYKNGWAWFGNTTDLGSIESIEVVVRSGASASLKYDLSVGTSAFTTAQTGGTQFDSSGKGSYTGSGKGFFAISNKPMDNLSKIKNGQIALLTVKYTIS